MYFLVISALPLREQIYPNMVFVVDVDVHCARSSHQMCADGAVRCTDESILCLLCLLCSAASGKKGRYTNSVGIFYFLFLQNARKPTPLAGKNKLCAQQRCYRRKCIRIQKLGNYPGEWFRLLSVIITRCALFRCVHDGFVSAEVDAVVVAINQLFECSIRFWLFPVDERPVNSFSMPFPNERIRTTWDPNLYGRHRKSC